MTSTPLVHEIPNLPVQRIMLTLMGSFVFFMAPYDLARGIWPVNIFTPLFAALVAAGMGLGGVFIYAGLFSPAVKYQISQNGIFVRLQYLRGFCELFYPVAAIISVSVMSDSNTDGPDDWYAVVNIKEQKPLRSRPFGSEATAQGHAAQFRAALGMVA